MIKELFILGTILVLSFLIFSCASSPLHKSKVKLEETKPQYYTSPVFGTIEYEIQGTLGIPVLVSHGITGSYFGGLVIAQGMLPDNQKIISISRFGYLGSSFPDDVSPKAQTAAWIELLDHLSIDKVIVLAASAGGTLGFRFVLDYPQRSAGLILVSSGYPYPEASKRPKGPPLFIFSNPVFGFLLSSMPGTARSIFGISNSMWNNAADGDKQGIEQQLLTILPLDKKRKGIKNDLYVNNYDMTEHYEDYKLEDIFIPVLSLHAKDDPMATYDRIEGDLKRIKNCTICHFEKGGHLMFTHGKEITAAVADYLRNL